MFGLVAAQEWSSRRSCKQPMGCPPSSNSGVVAEVGRAGASWLSLSDSSLPLVKRSFHRSHCRQCCVHHIAYRSLAIFHASQWRAWFPGLLLPWCAGSPVYWSTGLVVCWSLVPVCWSSGLPVFCPALCFFLQMAVLQQRLEMERRCGPTHLRIHLFAPPSPPAPYPPAVLLIEMRGVGVEGGLVQWKPSSTFLECNWTGHACMH